MSLILKENSNFRNVIRFSKEISSELSIFLYTDYLIMQINDLFQKMFVEITVQEENFKSEKEYPTITINSINLHQILLFANRFSDIEIFFNNRDMDININHNNTIKKFKFPYLNKNINKKKIKLNYNHSFQINTKNFYEIIKKCNEISSAITIEIKKNKLLFNSLGDFASITLEKYIEFDKDIDIKMNFCSKSLLSISKMYKISEYLQIEFEEELPLKIVGKIEGIQINAFLVQENI